MQNTERLKLFADISAVLTGFNVMELWGTGMMEVYFDWIETKCTPTDLAFFYDEVSKVLSDNPTPAMLERAVASSIFPNSSYNGLAQKLITLWYMGSWVDAESGATVIPTAEAYVQGLVWTAGQSHPPGAKQPGFASWANQPDM